MGFPSPLTMTWVIQCPHISHHPTIRYMVYNGYFFRWCPIFPKWDIYQPLYELGSFSPQICDYLQLILDMTWIFNCYFFLFCSFWNLLVSRIPIKIGNWSARYFEKMLLKLYWPYFFSKFAPGCAYLRPKLRPCFLLQIALRYGKCSLFLILITILDICANAPKVQASKMNVTIKDPGIYIYIRLLLKIVALIPQLKGWPKNPGLTWVADHFLIQWEIQTGELQWMLWSHTPWRIHSRCCYINGVPWIPSMSAPVMLALIYQHR